MTQLEKARFFAQYLESAMCEMKFIDGSRNYVSIISPTQVEAVKYGYQKIEGVVNNLRSAKVELTRLEDISDEDAIEVGKLRLPFVKEAEIQHKVVRGEFNVTIAFCKKDKQFHWVEVNEFTNNTASTDYLRSKSYALPFRNYSVEQLVELGVVKLK